MRITMKQRPAGRRRSRMRAVLWRLAAVFAGLLLLMLALDWRLRPMIRDYSETTARTLSMRAASDAVARVLNEGRYDYSSLIRVSRNADGAIDALETDAMTANRLQSEVTAALLAELSGERFRNLSIPLGSLTGSALLTGRGPGVPLRLQQAGTVVTRLESSFEEAGINQTNHRLELSLTFRVMALIPGHSTAVEVETNLLVAETVLVGEVPDAYAHIGKLFGE